jgi:hypothetical protein
MVRHFRKSGGLLTIEWVGIAVIAILAALAIAAFVMQEADPAPRGVGGSAFFGEGPNRPAQSLPPAAAE